MAQFPEKRVWIPMTEEFMEDADGAGMVKPPLPKKCKKCNRMCEYIEDVSGGNWWTVKPWGMNNRRSCKEGMPPGYYHEV